MSVDLFKLKRGPPYFTFNRLSTFLKSNEMSGGKGRCYNVINPSSECVWVCAWVGGSNSIQALEGVGQNKEFPKTA